MEEYFLHSRINDSFHFRLKNKPNSLISSFTITYIWDGTCIMSGDRGSIMWQRSFHDGPEYGFPSEKTNLEYFKEKVNIADENQNIEEWDPDAAVETLVEWLKEEEENKFKINAIKQNARWWDSYYDMIQDMNDLEIEYDEVPGFITKDTFVQKFEILKQVSPFVLAEVQNN